MNPDFPFQFQPQKMGLRAVLGDLESAIMEEIWARPSATVRQVFKAIGDERDIAYTTVMTVMSRLAEKGLLTREKVGQAFVYRATLSQADFQESALRKMFRSVLKNFGKPALSTFVETVDQERPGTMEELSRLIEARRQVNNND